MADGNSKGKITKKLPRFGHPASQPNTGPHAVARDSVRNILKPGSVFVLVEEPSVADDTFHLVPTAKGTRKKELKTEKVPISKDVTAVHFLDPVQRRGFTYELLHGRANGKARNVVVDSLPSDLLPKYAHSTTKVRPSRKHVPWRPPKAEEVETNDELLKEHHVSVTTRPPAQVEE